MIHLFYKYLWSNPENYSRSAGICAGLFLEGLFQTHRACHNPRFDPNSAGDFSLLFFEFCHSDAK